MKETIFICTAYRDDIEKNTEKAREIARAIILNEGKIPVVPHLIFPQFLDENEEEREIGIAMGIRLLGFCDEMRVYGAPTEGMKQEIEAAKKINKILKRDGYEEIKIKYYDF